MHAQLPTLAVEQVEMNGCLALALPVFPSMQHNTLAVSSGHGCVSCNVHGKQPPDPPVDVTWCSPLSCSWQIMVDKEVAEEVGGLKKLVPTGTAVLMEGVLAETPEGTKQVRSSGSSSSAWQQRRQQPAPAAGHFFQLLFPPEGAALSTAARGTATGGACCECSSNSAAGAAERV